MVSTTGAALLGLTVGCARCHDHKFDPIPTRDYYRMLAALHSGDRAEVPLGTRAEVDGEQAGAGRVGQAAQGRGRPPQGVARRAEEDARAGRPRAGRSTSSRSPTPRRPCSATSPTRRRRRRSRRSTRRRWPSPTPTGAAAMDDAARRRWDELAGELAAVRKREPKSLPTALAFRDAGGEAGGELAVPPRRLPRPHASRSSSAS